MLVSVAIITYNQEKYIRKAIESVLMQKRDFDIEILIGDDASSDQTSDILREYDNKYPGLFRLKLHENNVGATKNSHDIYSKAKGKYLALLEGDDYWTDDQKLQKQVDFLEMNPEYVGCSCLCHVVDAYNERYSPSEENKILDGLYGGLGNIYTKADYESGKLPGQAGGLVFKNLFKTMDTKILYKAHRIIGDYTIAMFIVSHGNIYRMQEYMLNYRKVRSGGDSWTAAGEGNDFVFLEIFNYHTCLEKYAKNNLSWDYHAKGIKENMFFSACMGYLQYPFPAERRMLIRSFVKTCDKGFYAKILLECCYYRFLKRTILSVNTDEWELYKKTAFGKMRWNNFLKCKASKKVILYGAGGGAVQILRDWYDELVDAVIVDRSRARVGKYIIGHKIFPLSYLDSVDVKNTVVLITPSSSIKEIRELLEEKGFEKIYSGCYMELNRLRYLLFRKCFIKRSYLKMIS
ncbi:MAG: glycosyltransferase [Lachnospiraceae bacterium]|nr:glycosyltransferase [Lachnospiraceae bacterium]